MLTNWPVSIWYKFLQKLFFQAGCWNLDFNSNNSNNSCYKKSTLNLHLLKKSTQKLSSWKEILSWMVWDFSIVQQKHALTCPGFYRLIFQSLYYTSLILPQQEADEIINFSKLLRRMFINKFAAFFRLWHPFPKGKNETKWHKIR